MKLYPKVDDNSSGGVSTGAMSTGTGFALSSNGYIITNHHVIANARNSRVRVSGGIFDKWMSAKVMVQDERNDLAIIRIDDPAFSSLGVIPYTFKQATVDVGTEVFVLGFPLVQAMGGEVKLTNGIVSAKTGYHGDIATYQTNAAVQPGNSGGPMFDENGYVIGVVNAGIPDAENVGYAIKSSYVGNLLELLPQTITLPQTNQLFGKPLTEQVKLASRFIYLILVNGD